MKISRSLAASIGLTTALSGTLCTVLATAGPAGAATPPTSYSGAATSSILDLSADLATQSLTDVTVGYSHADANSARSSGDATAADSNLKADLAGQGLPKNGSSASAAPSQETTSGPDDGTVPGVLGLGGVATRSTATYKGDSTCPALSTGTTRPLSRGAVQLARATVVPDLPAIGPVAQVSASKTIGTTQIVGTKVVSTTTTTVGDISLLAGQVLVKVTQPVVVSATSDGTTGSTSFNNPTITVSVAGQTPVDLKDIPGGSVALPAALAPLVSLDLTAFKPTDSSSGRVAQADLPAVLKIHVKALSALGGSLTDVSLDVAPTSARAVAPAGGVDCAGVTDSDGDGLTDAKETSLGTSPTDPDTDNDGLTDGQEVNTYKTNPKKADTDGDGLTDGAEVKTYKTSPTKTDTDGDGLSDGSEVKTYKTSPTKSDTDGDGVKDGSEVKGYKVTYTVRTASGTKTVTKTVKTDPKDADTDGDGIKDGTEAKPRTLTFRAKRHGSWVTYSKTVVTDPTNPDTDGDGIKDGPEVSGSANTVSKRRSDPLDVDSDHGGVYDGAEVKRHTDPTVGGD